MKTKVVALAAAALLAAGAAAPAEARHGSGGGRGGGGRSHSSGSVHISRSVAPHISSGAHVRISGGGVGRHYRRGRGYGVYIGDPYYYSDYYGDDCGWLLARARATGKRYWWRRYYACIAD